MVAEAVRARALDITALTALVGTRIRTLKLKQNEVLPAVRISQITETEAFHLRGTAGIIRARVQVDAYAAEATGGDPYASAQAVSAAAHGEFVNGEANGLSGWRGVVSTFDVLSIRPVDRREQYDADELRRVIVSRDYLVTMRASS